MARSSFPGGAPPVPGVARGRDRRNLIRLSASAQRLRLPLGGIEALQIARAKTADPSSSSSISPANPSAPEISTRAAQGEQSRSQSSYTRSRHKFAYHIFVTFCRSFGTGGRYHRLAGLCLFLTIPATARPNGASRGSDSLPQTNG